MVLLRPFHIWSETRSFLCNCVMMLSLYSVSELREEEGGPAPMKMNIEIDCSPEEARALLGLPDVTEANEAYVQNITKLMKGAGGIEQLQELGKQIAPMGQMGLQLFQQLIETGAKAAFSGVSPKDKK